jgi:hypothetical protein
MFLKSDGGKLVSQIKMKTGLELEQPQAITENLNLLD